MFKSRYTGILIFAAGFSLLMISACTGLRHVGEGKHLYTGCTIQFDSTQFLLQAGATKNELEDLFPFRPNRKILWMRPLLCLHDLIAEPKKETGFWHWMKYKLGEPPSILEEMSLPDLALTMENRLQNHGHFLARTRYEVELRKRTARVKFEIMPGKPYVIKSIKYPEGEFGIEGEIHRLQSGSILKTGKNYELKDFENERARIENVLKEKGFFYFTGDYLIFTADTTVGDKQINVRLALKPDLPPEAFTAYRFKNIYVIDDFSLGDYMPDTSLIDHYYYVSQNHQFKPQVILNSVFLDKDSLYSRKNHYSTIKHLMGIGVYKYATARFFPSAGPIEKQTVSQTDSVLDSTITEAGIDANILLTPFKKISLSAEMSAAVKTTGFAGPGLKLSYRNRNFLGGAELFAITLGGNIEAQLKGDSKGQISYQVNVDASITLPKFTPFEIRKKDSKSVFPKTIITTGVGIYSRVNLYELRSFNMSLGYNWRSGDKISHLFRPVDISYTDLFKTSPEFEEYLTLNPNVRKSFEEQFIIGGSYTFVYSDFGRQNSHHNFYLSESLDLAGNTANAIASIGNGSPSDAPGAHKLLGVAFSQFIRIRNEERYFFNLTKTSQLGMRLITGVGFPYKNSTTMPYNKQYFTGGPSSIRAFFSRSIGPGTYQVPDSLSNVSIDQAGDIILESSLEYRFDILKSFKGALFTDAGNIWLVNDDPQRVGGKFNFNTFYKEIAIGSGIGFRFDFTFLILRFDVAVPIRKPWLPEEDRWVFDKIALGSSSWRNENIIWNIAIGYPF